VLVLLNMVLAIVMDNYAVVTGDLAEMPDTPAIWTQCSRFYKRMKQARKGKYVSFPVLLQRLTDASSMVHEEEVVTTESLNQAFPDLGKGQVGSLLNWLQKDADTLAAKSHEDQSTKLMEETLSSLQCIAENLHAITLGITRCSRKIESVDDSMRGNNSLLDSANAGEGKEQKLSTSLDPCSGPCKIYTQSGPPQVAEEGNQRLDKIEQQILKQQKVVETLASSITDIIKSSPQMSKVPQAPQTRETQPISIGPCFG